MRLLVRAAAAVLLCARRPADRVWSDVRLWLWELRALPELRRDRAGDRALRTDGNRSQHSCRRRAPGAACALPHVGFHCGPVDGASDSDLSASVRDAAVRLEDRSAAAGDDLLRADAPLADSRTHDRAGAGSCAGFVLALLHRHVWAVQDDG